MEVLRAGKAGFCMGVALALRKLDKAVYGLSGELSASGVAGGVATLGPIIHNPQVLEEYESKGVRKLSSPHEAKPEMRVLIRAHGIPRQDEQVLRASGAVVVDATCPRVKEAQLAIARATANGQRLLLFGEAEHPEVKGLLSYAQGPWHVFADTAELRRLLDQILPEAGSFVLAAQTTQDRPEFDAFRKELYACMDKRLQVLDTICDATRQRQEEVIALAAKVQVMVVVGGRQSGNTRRLADIAQGCGVRTLLVETEDEIDDAFFTGIEVVGLTAGASTPRSIIDAVERRLMLIGA